MKKKTKPEFPHGEIQAKLEDLINSRRPAVADEIYSSIAGKFGRTGTLTHIGIDYPDKVLKLRSEVRYSTRLYAFIRNNPAFKQTSFRIALNKSIEEFFEERMRNCEAKVLFEHDEIRVVRTYKEQWLDAESARRVHEKIFLLLLRWKQQEG